MIKRRFYKHEHGDRDAPSDSSSSSDSELEAGATDESEGEEDDVAVEVRHDEQPGSSSEGYESEDSSGNEVDLDSSGLLTNDDDDIEPWSNRRLASEIHSDDENSGKIVDPQENSEAEDDAIPSDMPDFVLKSKSVFKCKICPRIVCLTEETLKAHLKSKRHSRSEKLLSEGRLKLMLNSDGEIEGETYQDRRHASAVASVQPIKVSDISKRKNRGGRGRE